MSQLVDFAIGVQFDDLPPPTVQAANQRIIDTIGCAIGGRNSPPTDVARRLAYPIQGTSGARIWGVLTRTTPEAAAFANGVALRFLDYNDAYIGEADVGHPSDNLGALIAIAEERHVPGADLLVGTVVAYEVQAALAESVPLRDLGWDQPTAVALSAALGVGRIVSLPAERLAHATSLAIVPNLAMHQTRVPELTWWKGCAAPLGACQGLFAARMAEAGVEGPHDPFVGRNGLWAQLGARYELPPLGQRPPRWAVQRSQVKSWPVRGSCQIAIDTALELLAGGVNTNEIDALTVETTASSQRWSAADPEMWRPRTRETADHSLPFCVAAALIDGGVRVETIDAERFLDRDVLDLIGRLTVVVDDIFSAETPGVANCRITAECGSTSHTAHRRLSQGEAVPTSEQVETKLRELAAGVLANGQCDDILIRLRALDACTDVAQLVDLLHYPPREAP